MVAVQSIKGYGWRPDKPDKRDQAYLYRPTYAKLARQGALPAEIIPPVGDQGGQGSCTGWSSAHACDFLRAQSRQDMSIRLSPTFAYWNGRKIEGSTSEDSGAEIRDVIRGIRESGLASLELCPYNDQDYTTMPSQQAYTEAQSDLLKNGYSRIAATGKTRIRYLKQAIQYRHPVVFGFTVYENFEDDGPNSVGRTGLMQMPRGDIVGGHAIWEVEHDDDKSIAGETGGVKIQNSWGTDWGQEGYFWMPYSYAADPNLCDDFWVLRGIS